MFRVSSGNAGQSPHIQILNIIIIPPEKSLSKDKDVGVFGSHIMPIQIRIWGILTAIPTWVWNVGQIHVMLSFPPAPVLDQNCGRCWRFRSGMISSTGQEGVASEGMLWMNAMWQMPERSSSAPSPLVTEEGRGQGTVNPRSWFLTDVQADSVWGNSSQTAGNSRIQVSTQVYLEPLRWESWMILSTLWYGIPR